MPVWESPAHVCAWLRRQRRQYHHCLLCARKNWGSGWSPQGVWGRGLTVCHHYWCTYCLFLSFNSFSQGPTCDHYCQCFWASTASVRGLFVTTTASVSELQQLQSGACLWPLLPVAQCFWVTTASRRGLFVITKTSVSNMQQFQVGICLHH